MLQPDYVTAWGESELWVQAMIHNVQYKFSNQMRSKSTRFCLWKCWHFILMVFAYTSISRIWFTSPLYHWACWTTKRSQGNRYFQEGLAYVLGNYYGSKVKITVQLVNISHLTLAFRSCTLISDQWAGHSVGWSHFLTPYFQYIFKSQILSISISSKSH